MLQHCSLVCCETGMVRAVGPLNADIHMHACKHKHRARDTIFGIIYSRTPKIAVFCFVPELSKERHWKYQATGSSGIGTVRTYDILQVANRCKKAMTRFECT